MELIPGLDTAALAAFGAFLGIFIVVAVLAYVYQAWATMVVAQKLKQNNAWLAWIPLANLFLIAIMAKKPWWTALIVVVVLFIPYLNAVAGIVSLAASVWWWWSISSQRGYPSWFGVLMAIPIVQWVALGMLAWNDK